MTAKLSTLGATLVMLYAPDREGKMEDVVLGYKDAAAYRTNWLNLGATVGRCANRIRDGCFNPKGHQYPEKALEQELMLPSSYYLPCDGAIVPTGEIWSVENTPMDFCTPKTIGRDIHADYEPLQLSRGYDHSHPTEQPLCARLSDPVSGRVLSVYTDRPAIHIYSGNFIDLEGKDGVHYCDQSGIALETQCYPDAIHHSHWPQPIAKANQPWVSRTDFVFDIA